MHSNYITDERVMKNILKENVRPISPNDKVKLITYYTNKRTSNLVMRNNTHPIPVNDQKTNLVYSFSCPHSHNQPSNYIGLTQTKLSRRLGSHVQAGSIKQHYINDHGIKPTKTELINNTKILAHASDRYRLSIKEALLNLHSNPTINRQFENFTHTLKLKPNRNISASQAHQRANNFANGTDPPITTSPDHLVLSHNLSIASSNEFTNNHLLNIQSTPTSSFSHTASTPANVTTNSHYISPNINQRINTLINSTRTSNISNQAVNNTRSPINLRPRSQHIRYLY